MRPDNQEKLRKKLYSLLGSLPHRQRKIRTISSVREQREHYLLEKLVLDLNGIEPVPAYFIMPRRRERHCPVILYNHAHGGNYELGKDEFIEGREIVRMPPYAELLATLGYCGLCIDSWTFGERAHGKEQAVFKEMLWNGQVLWGMMVYDHLRAVDFLFTRSEVDVNKIGVVGISMGSTMAWWLAALDTRIGLCIDICCLTDYETLVKEGNIDRHGLYYFVPGLRKYFTTWEINALIAPRIHLSLAGNLDPLTPPSGLERIDRELQRIYRMNNAQENWKLLRWDTGHGETDEMRKKVVNILKKWKGNNHTP